MKRMQFVLVLMGVIAILMGGCSKSQGTKYNYATGNLSATLSGDLQQSYDASLKALEQLQLTPTEKAKDLLGARVVAKTSDDKTVTISLKPAGDTLTAIVIEVGMVGNKDTSRTIYDKIVENLKK